MAPPFVVYPILLGAFFVAVFNFYMAGLDQRRISRAKGAPERRSLLLGLVAVVVSVVYNFVIRLAPDAAAAQLVILIASAILLVLAISFMAQTRGWMDRAR